MINSMGRQTTSLKITDRGERNQKNQTKQTIMRYKLDAINFDNEL